MAGSYLELPQWRGLYVTKRALANMISREVNQFAIERIKRLVGAYELVEAEFEVFREVIQKFESTADGSHWSDENILYLRGLAEEALNRKDRPPNCVHIEMGLTCRLDAGHQEPHVY